MLKIIFLSIILMLGATVLVRAEDWTVNGRGYHNVKVTSVTDDMVRVTYDGGVGAFNLADLTPDLKKRFSYDPAKAKAAAAQREQQLAQAQAESLKTATPSVEPISSSSQVIQVLPDGFLGSFMCSKGQLDSCFIKCDTKGIIEGQSWTGKVLPNGTFTYSDTDGASHTVAQFTTDLTAEASAMPQLHGYPRPPVSSLQSVGGG